MKKCLIPMLILCVLFAACDSATAKTEPVAQEPDSVEEVKVPGATINPLPDTTMDNLSDAILAVSLEEGDAYVDDTGKMQMDLTIYSYDKYDMVDVSMLKVGDVLITHGGEVELTSVERTEDGVVSINGGLLAGGLDLITEDNGIFFEQGLDDRKNWYEVGKATIRVSVDFHYYDTSDLEQGEIVYYPGSFLIGEVTDYDFTPYNTTIRVEAGQIIEMHRVFVP